MEKKKNSLLQNEFAVLSLIILGVLILMGALNPVRFFRISNLQSMAFQMPELGLLSLGMMLIMITGGINLSVIATANIAGIVSALVMQGLAPPETFAGTGVGVAVVAILAGLTVAALVGFLNGVLVAYVGVSPILATLGMMTLLNGVTIVMTKGYVISGFPPAFQFIGNGIVLGIPVPIILFALIAVVLGFIMRRTPYGLEVYMMGTNETAAKYAGINVPVSLIKSYILSGLLSGMAAMIMISRFNSAKSDYGASYLLVTVLAAVLGGTNVYGGFGKVLGLVLSLIILQIVASGLNLLQVNAFLTRAIWGMILAAVMILNYYRHKAALQKR